MHDVSDERSIAQSVASSRSSQRPTLASRRSTFDWYSSTFGVGHAVYERSTHIAYPVTNDHPALHERGAEHEQIWRAQTAPEGKFDGDVLSKWLIMLPQVAVRHFQLEPNFNDGDGSAELWVGRMWQFRRLLWLQYCARRSFSVNVPSPVKEALARRYAPGTAEHAALTCVQRWLRGWFTRFRGYPRFLDQLVGKNVRSIVVYMHGR